MQGQQPIKKMNLVRMSISQYMRGPFDKNTLYCVTDYEDKIHLFVGADEIFGDSPMKLYTGSTLFSLKIPGEIISDATFKSGYSEYERDENGNIIEKPSVSV